MATETPNRTESFERYDDVDYPVIKYTYPDNYTITLYHNSFSVQSPKINRTHNPYKWLEGVPADSDGGRWLASIGCDPSDYLWINGTKILIRKPEGFLGDIAKLKAFDPIAIKHADKIGEAAATGKPVFIKSWTEDRRAKLEGEWGDYMFSVTLYANPDGTISRKEDCAY